MTTSSPSTDLRAASTDPSPISDLRVLIADDFEQSGIDELRSLGCSVTFDPDLSAKTLPAAITTHDPDVLIVRSTKVEAPAVETANSLSLIVRAGAGYDTIDVAAASARGIFVANCPGKNSIAVAELVWSLILACDRRVPDQTADLRAGRWNKTEYAKASGLCGRTLGIIGLGRIGREVAKRGKGFGMQVIAWSRNLTEEAADQLGVGYCSNLINLAKLADVISVNVAANEETVGLVGEKFCAALKPGAYLINTSRGSVVDEGALAAAIREKGVRAGLDVFATEPQNTVGSFSDNIVREPRVYGTHHVGACTDQAQEAIATEVVQVIEMYQKTGAVPNCVNRAKATAATNLLTVRHLNRPGVLAAVFYTLGQAGINVEEMENVIYEGAKAACARIQLDKAPSSEHLTAIRANDDVLSVDLSTIHS
ncbi:MAG: 3-phosphoglycerate dehydrogenase family protein [Planctomycetota bacterium]|jgi:D-3-phosphoglycerate dehydrogenase